jgi:hypothetical protein
MPHKPPIPPIRFINNDKNDETKGDGLDFVRHPKGRQDILKTGTVFFEQVVGDVYGEFLENERSIP